jgi:hypothetical protein
MLQQEGADEEDGDEDEAAEEEEDGPLVISDAMELACLLPRSQRYWMEARALIVLIVLVVRLSRSL